MKSTKKLPPATGPRGEIDDGDHPGASPSLRAHLDWINNTAADHFPQVIAAIETERSISQKERDWIAEQLIGAAGIYKLRIEVEAARLPPAQQRRRFEDIATSSTRLLKLLGIKDAGSLATGWPTPKGRSGRWRRAISQTAPRGLPFPLGLLLPVLQRIALERRGEAVTMEPLSRVTTLLLLLSDLAEAAKRAAGPANPSRRGGPRRDGPEAIGELYNSIFEIYAAIRKRRPASGPESGFGGPIFRFVVACMKVIDPDLEVAESSIRGHYNRWAPSPT